MGVCSFALCLLDQTTVSERLLHAMAEVVLVATEATGDSPEKGFSTIDALDVAPDVCVTGLAPSHVDVPANITLAGAEAALARVLFLLGTVAGGFAFVLGSPPSWLSEVAASAFLEGPSHGETSLGCGVLPL